MKLGDRIPAANALGECVLWDGEAVWWTDIDGRRLHRFDWSSGACTCIATPARLASFAFIEGRRELLAAFEDGFALFDPVTGLAGGKRRPEGLGDGLRMNDGRVDRQGRFWAGSMVERDGGPAEARLYCVEGGRVRTCLDALGIANGLAFSPDGRRCYFADSRARTIWRFAFDPETGMLSDRTEFARARGEACPDGAAVDSDGCLWSAQWGGSCVVRYTPEGRIDQVVEIAVSLPTCVAFGGPDLDHLFVTTAQSGTRRAETGAGDVFVYNAGVRGLAESRCRTGIWPEITGLQG